MQQIERPEARLLGPLCCGKKYFDVLSTLCCLYASQLRRKIRFTLAHRWLILYLAHGVYVFDEIKILLSR